MAHFHVDMRPLEARLKVVNMANNAPAWPFEHVSNIFLPELMHILICPLSFMTSRLASRDNVVLVERVAPEHSPNSSRRVQFLCFCSPSFFRNKP